MKRSQFTPPEACGFTLIELLIVVAIIAILAGMLLPALNSARARGRAATCMSNLKQVSTARQLYTDDNNDFYPTVGGVVCEDIAYQNAVYWAQSFGALKYLPKKWYGVARCPELINPDRSTINDGWISYGVNLAYLQVDNGSTTNKGEPIYVMNQDIVDSDTPFGGFFSNKLMKKPSVYPVYADVMARSDRGESLSKYAFYKFNTDGYNGVIGAVHSNAANSVFGDGHVEAVNLKRWSPDFCRTVADKNFNLYDRNTGAIGGTW